jgi:hypothetical protein
LQHMLTLFVILLPLSDLSSPSSHIITPFVTLKPDLGKDHRRLSP